MARTALRLLGIQELAELLDVTTMDVKNWRRRDKLPEPACQLAYGPVWTPDQFPAKLRKELTAARDRPPKSTTTRRSGKQRTTTPKRRRATGKGTAARSRTRSRT